MTTADKIRWALGLAVVFLLISLSGRSNVQSSKEIQAAIETLYADRLVVKGLIFDLSSILHDKELAMARHDQGYFAEQNGPASARALELVEEFRGTYLVPLERKTLERFATTLSAMMKTEDELDLGSGDRFEGELAERLRHQINRLQADLAALSQIQLDEGRRQMTVGEKAIEKIDLFDTVETYMLAMLGALAVVIVVLIPRRSPA